ncbi:LacI family DNA-binding transcriptional regulator [Vibrio japonicus]|uniref:LacI family transcriptional regulator n=1 Tax=Vibrio japonicus TaxID=1824638 RepID=A0ABY5LDF4_9VIBR|nr:LacI family DNA-binding transcriptional regulator [Vibrio japonicus]UUM30054.1 LacI family transcriptional regulator [Vibrio japonicus]
MTVRDVAKRAGVSIATVSRVLNGSHRVSAEAKIAVERAIQGLNYQKPAAAKKKATKLFAVIVRNMSNPFFAQLIDVLEEEAYKHGRSILLFNSRNNLQLEKTFLSECVNHKVDGVFLIPRSLKPEHITHWSKLPFPVVLLTTTIPGMASIGTNHKQGGIQVAEHFIKHGYRRIGFIGASDTLSDRFIGFRDRLLKHEIELPEEKVLAPYTFEELQRYMQDNVVESKQPLEAVFCSDDISASHFYNELKALKDRKVEVDIVGFDDTVIAQSLGFSSIRQPIKQIALLGFDAMIQGIRAGTLEHQPTMLEPTLIVRHAPVMGVVKRTPEILRSR